MEDVIERAKNEPAPTEPLRAHNDSAAEAWLRGYGDAHAGRDVKAPEHYVTEYLRGYVAGLRARRT
jgi:hypothetical protein